MPLDKDIQLLELYQLKHMYDSLKYQNFNWQQNLLKKTTSNHLWKNANMNAYMTRIEAMLVLMVEKISVARNFFLFTKRKYEQNHWG